jgi:hypothetical protein
MLAKNQKNLNDVGYYVNDKKDENVYDKYGIEVFDIVNNKFKQGMTEEE